MGLCDRCLSELLDCRPSQSFCYFQPSFVNCCPSNLLSGWTLPPPPPPFPVRISIRSTRIQCVRRRGRVWGSGPQTDEHLPQSPLEINFLDDDIFHCLLWVLSFYASPLWLYFVNCAGILGQSMGAKNSYRIVPPGYIGWRNRFLGIDSWAS